MAAIIAMESDASLVYESVMNELQQTHSFDQKRMESYDAPRHWFRFHTRHLLGLMASVAIAFAALDFAIKHFGATNTTVEIINYHPTWEPSGSVEFLVLLPNGFSQSGVSVPNNRASIDYSKLIGKTFPMRYRAQRILWLPPENPTIVAYHLVQRKVDQFGNDVRDQ